MAYTEEQESVITHESGHSVVMATAGSGKTTTMIARTIYMLHDGIDHQKILVLLYNKEAEVDFTSRLKDQVKRYDFGMPDVRTFHSFGLKLSKLLEQRGLLPELRNFVSEGEVNNLARKCLSSAARAAKSKMYISNELIEDFLKFIELVKSDIIPPNEKFEQLKYKKEYSFFSHAFNMFEKIRINGSRPGKSGFRTFSDMIYDPVMLMRKDKSLRSSISAFFKRVIVDEYQDVNGVQQELLRMIVGDQTEIMAVGDADQCIYEWRGARPEFITSKFEEDFPGATRYSLSYTFRYGHELSLAANYVIQNNLDRVPQICVSSDGNPDTSISIHSTRKFDSKTSEIIKNWSGEYHEAVVLVRLYAMASSVELDFLAHGIPYRLEGGEKRSVLNQPIMEGMLNVVRLARGDFFDADKETKIERFKSLLTILPFRVAEAELDSLYKRLAECENSIDASIVLRNISNIEEVSFTKKSYYVRSEFIKTIGSIKNASASELIKLAREILKLDKYYENLYVRSQSSYEKTKLLNKIIEVADTIEENGESFVSFIEDCRNVSESRAKKKTDAVTITTIHKAKGKEWPLVIIPDLIEGDFPYYESSSPEVDVESERRLFYVALTRAEKEAHLLYPVDERLTELSNNYDTDISDVEPGKSSRFLREMNHRLSSRVSKNIYMDTSDSIDAVNGIMANMYLRKIGCNKVKVNSQLRAGDKKVFTKPKGFVSGDRVLHKIYGEGAVEKIIKDENDLIVINFDKEKSPVTFVLKNIDLRKVN